MSTIVSYAQNREDILLEAFFPDIQEGFYVDVGANHPVNDSVTKRFYDKGWRGINIEPNQKLWRLLQSDRPRDINLQVGVSDKTGSFLFREYQNHGLSTFSPEMKRSYEKDKQATGATSKFREYEVPVTTLKDIFDKHLKGRPIHFLKIDIEGYEYEALAANDWQQYRPMMICIESNHIMHDWRPLLKKQGYQKVFFDGLNDYYLSDKQQKRAQFFDYPAAVLIDKQVISLGTFKQFSQRDKKIASLRQVIEQQKQALQSFRTEKNQLEVRLREHRRIRQQAGELVRSIDRACIEIIDSLVRQRYPRGLTQVRVDQADTLKDQLELAQRFDQAFLRVSPWRRSLHDVLLFGYRAARKAIRVVGKLVWQGLKTLKKVVKR